MSLGFGDSDSIRLCPEELSYRIRTSQGIAIAGLFLLTPFSLNNFVQGRPALGFGSLMIVFLLANNAWSIRSRRTIPWTTPGILCPAIIVFLMLCFHKQGVVGAFWCYPSILAFYFMVAERHARVLNIMLMTAVLPIAADTIATPLAWRVAATLVAVSVFTALSIRTINDQQHQLRMRAVLDPLTGVHNRALLDATLERSAVQSSRTGVPVTLISIDLDHFKSINDNFGHAAGDLVLREVGSLLKTRLRRSDQVFRLGGEEFLVLLHGTDRQAGVQVAEELRLAIRQQHPHNPTVVTASLGVAQFDPSEPWDRWLRRADAHLYRAKEGGRDRVAC